MPFGCILRKSPVHLPNVTRAKTICRSKEDPRPIWKSTWWPSILIFYWNQVDRRLLMTTEHRFKEMTCHLSQLEPRNNLHLHLKIQLLLQVNYRPNVRRPLHAICREVKFGVWENAVMQYSLGKGGIYRPKNSFRKIFERCCWREQELIRRWDSKRKLLRSAPRKLPEFAEITQNNGHYSIQGHSRSSIFTQIESSYTTSYQWLILTYLLSCIVSEI